MRLCYTTETLMDFWRPGVALGLVVSEDGNYRKRHLRLTGQRLLFSSPYPGPEDIQSNNDGLTYLSNGNGIR